MEPVENEPDYWAERDEDQAQYERENHEANYQRDHTD